MLLIFDDEASGFTALQTETGAFLLTEGGAYIFLE